MKTPKIGIAGYDQMKDRNLANARGEQTPGKGEPKVWFISVNTARIVSDGSRPDLRSVKSPSKDTYRSELKSVGLVAKLWEITGWSSRNQGPGVPPKFQVESPQLVESTRVRRFDKWNGSKFRKWEW